MGCWHSWSLVGMAIATVHIAQPFSAQAVSVTEVARIAKNITVLIENYTRAIALNRQYTEAYGIRSFLNLLLGNFGTAVTDGDRALALSPNNRDLQMIQSLVLFLSGDFRRSIPVFDRLIAAKSTDYHLLRGIAAFLMGDYALSRPSWTALTQLTPKDLIPFVVRAVTYLLEQNPKPSLADLRQAAELYRQQGNMQSYNERMDAIRQIENR